MKKSNFLIPVKLRGGTKPRSSLKAQREQSRKPTPHSSEGSRKALLLEAALFLHPFRLRVSPRRTLQISVFFLGCLSADLLALGVLVPELRQARSLQGLGRLSEDSEPPHASAPAPAAQSAQRTLAVSLLSSFPSSHGLDWPLTTHSSSPFLPWLPTPARHHRHSRVPPLQTCAGRDEGMPGSEMRREAGTSGQGEPGQVESRGVRAGASVSEPQIKMHVLGHRSEGRTEGAGCKVKNAHREGAQNRRFAKCQGQTGRGGGRRLAEDQEQREETTSPSKGRFG